MTNNPLHAAYFADHAVADVVEIIENVPIAKDTFRLRFCQPELAVKITPGQFLMLRLADCSDPLIGRPLALYDTHDDPRGRPAEVEVVYLVHGKLTSRLAQCRPGRKLEIWGPLGNGFSGGFSSGSSGASAPHLVMAAGGIGQTPFLSLAKQTLGLRHYGSGRPLAEAPKVRVTFCYGAKSAAYLAGVDDFKHAGVEVCISTDDGSQGRHGFVTELLEDVLEESADACEVVCCGPEPMMKAVAEVAARRQTPCRVSLETPMACGIGVCFSCVAKVRDAAGGWDYKRTCVEGPVFDAADIVW